MIKVTEITKSLHGRNRGLAEGTSEDMGPSKKTDSVGRVFHSREAATGKRFSAVDGWKAEKYTLDT